MINNETFDKVSASNLDQDNPPLDKIENVKVSNEEENTNENEEAIEDDDEMIQLRMNLLNNLNEKRTIKKQKQLELEKEQVKQIDEDMSMFKKKLIEHEQELLIDESKELKKKIQNSSSSFKTTNKNNVTQSSSTGTSSLNNLNKNNAKTLISNDALPKISPVIIRLNSNETESDDEFSACDTSRNASNKQLESNIDLFLKEAKILAELKSTYENRKRAIFDPSTSRNVNTVASNVEQKANPVTQSRNVENMQAERTENSSDPILNIENFPNPQSISEQQQKTDKDKEQKNIIKTLRDRINLKRFVFLYGQQLKKNTTTQTKR